MGWSQEWSHADKNCVRHNVFKMYLIEIGAVVIGFGFNRIGWKWGWGVVSWLGLGWAILDFFKEWEMDKTICIKPVLSSCWFLLLPLSIPKRLVFHSAHIKFSYKCLWCTQHNTCVLQYSNWNWGLQFYQLFTITVNVLPFCRHF